MASISKRQIKNPEACTLAELCGLVMGLTYAYEDCADFIEDRSYAECESGRFEQTIHQLEELAGFFETLENKNDENVRDQSEIYVLIGDIFQYNDHFTESIAWFNKASIVDDSYDLPYHRMATAYVKLNDGPNAIKCFEQELRVAPGNYYSYLLLAALYEKRGEHELFEDCLKRLLERDPGNIQGLHSLIMHYQRLYPDADIVLLRKRLISATKQFSEIELVIWTYHLCEEKKIDYALSMLTSKENAPNTSIIHLLKAYLYGELGNFAKKRRELQYFKADSNGKELFMKNKLEEFTTIFGEKAAAKLRKQLIL